MTRAPLIPAAALGLAVLLTGCVEAGRTSSAAAAAVEGSEAAPCPVTPDESVEGEVRLGYQLLPSGDLVVKDLGVLEACLPGARITWTQYASGGDVVQAFGAGSLDVATVG
ncbi:MAG: hypothetical protein AVDCRST_MAG35-1047, partial [uncultured Quadrisphaera sp.]